MINLIIYYYRRRRQIATLQLLFGFPPRVNFVPD